MKVGILGTGDVGKALAQGFLERGDEVAVGSRDLEKVATWADEEGLAVQPATFADAAAFGDFVVLALKGAVAPDVVKGAGPEKFAGKVVLDVTNPLVFEEGKPPTNAWGLDDSGAERVQAALPDARVVKALNTVNNQAMAHPRFKGGTPQMMICGDDEDAKAEVARLLGDWGWPVLDLGGIHNARYLEALVLLWVQVGIVTGHWDHAFRIVRPG